MIVKKDRTLPELKELYNDPRGWLEKVSEKADLYRFRLKVVKVKGDWLVRGAYFERFTGTGFITRNFEVTLKIKAFASPAVLIPESFAWTQMRNFKWL